MDKYLLLSIDHSSLFVLHQLLSFIYTLYLYSQITSNIHPNLLEVVLTPQKSS